jgi:hypothetical protein
MVGTNALAWGVEPPQQNDKVFLQSARRMELLVAGFSFSGERKSARGYGFEEMQC